MNVLYTKGLCRVKIYCGDELIGKSPVCYSNDSVPIKISQNDISMELKITTKYESEQDAESGKWYLYADGVRVCEAFPKTEK